MQLQVIKCDASTEEYLHTKVLGAFHNALAMTDQSNVYAAEQFAEAITYYLYQKNTDQTITSDQIHLMVQAVLAATGYENAARRLNEYRLNRVLRRRRIEVIEESAPDGEQSVRWDKSRVVGDLMRERGIDYHTARAIASSVEEKVLNLGLTRIRRGLIRELVAADADALLEAQRQLETVVG